MKPSHGNSFDVTPSTSPKQRRRGQKIRSHRWPPFRRPLCRPIADGAGGYDFVEPPEQTGLDALIFWRADVLSRLVRLAPMRRSLDSLVRFTPERWGGRQRGRATPDGYHLIIAPDPGVTHHLLLPGRGPPAIGTPLVPMPAFDPWHAERVDATLAFWRFAQEPRVSRAPPIVRPKPTRHTIEAAFMLWALDLKRAGATDREVAIALYRMAPTVWSDTPLRAQVRRLIASAQRVSTSTYRLLLKPRRGRFGPL
jgi:hypothetical protein